MDILIIGLLCFIGGVVCHAAVIAWVDRIRDLAKSKVEEVKAKL
jgi:hypothetical protein